MEPDDIASSFKIFTSLAFARMPRAEARGGMATGDRAVARRANVLSYELKPAYSKYGRTMITDMGSRTEHRLYLVWKASSQDLIFSFFFF